MTLRELIDAIDREAEKALIGHRLDLDAELEVKGNIMVYAPMSMMRHEQKIEGKVLRLERVGARVFLVVD